MSRPARPTAAAALSDLPPGTIAIGWATVELDRAARELAGLLPPGEGFTDGPASVVLGARSRLGRIKLGDGREFRLVLMEPDAEGRLAATLARAGEGWAATWVPAGPRTRSGPANRSDPATPRVSAARPGPLGVERLVLGGPVEGPHRLLVEVATIEP